MTLDETEKLFIRDLNRNPTFAGICRKLRAEARIPKWKKNTDVSEAAKEAEWKYQSGRADGIDFSLIMLGYSDE